MSHDGWVALPRGAMGLSAVCDCGISWSYSLTIFKVKIEIPLQVRKWKINLSKSVQYWKYKKVYEDCSNMNASSFITFCTYMLWQNVLPFWKELFVVFKMAPNIKKHSLYLSSYRRFHKGHSCILKFFWSKLPYTFWYMCGYSVISL